MKVYRTIEEWFPVYLVELEDGVYSYEIELTDEEYVEYQQWIELKEKIQDMLSSKESINERH